jgi:hypothetical protein
MDSVARVGEMRTALLYSVNLKERDYLRNLVMERRIILKLILNAWSGTVLTDIWFSTEPAMDYCKPDNRSQSFIQDGYILVQPSDCWLPKNDSIPGTLDNYVQIHDKTNYECAGSKHKDTGTLFPKYEGSTQQWEMGSDG